MKRFLLYPALAVLALAGEPAVGAELPIPETVPAPGGPGFLLVPLDWLTRVFPHRAEPALDMTELRRESGWRQVVFPLSDRGLGVYLEVDGAAQFGRATVLLADGTRMDLDLHGARRGRGLYELTAFDSDREVIAVGVSARARSTRAHVAVRLGRVGGATE